MVQDKKPDPSAIREIPQDIQAEQSVLGAMLISREAVSEVAEMLVPQDFYRQSNRVIFNAMMTLYSRNDAVDLVTVTNELQKEGKLGDAEGVAYLTLLGNMVPTAANVKYHAKIVEEKSTLRQLVDGGTEIARMGYDGSEDVPVILDRAERCILQISNRKGGRDFEPISTIVGNTINRISELAGNTSGITGLKTGFVDFDRLTAGLHPSDFIILAARPSMGKTALALNIAQNVAIRGNGDGEPKKVAFFSLEMSREQLVQRMLCSEAEVDAQKLRVGQLSADDWTRLWQAADSLGNEDLHRRHAGPADHGDAQQGAAPAGPGRPGHDRRRLPAADAGQRDEGEPGQPPAGSLRDFPRPEGPGPRTERAGPGPVPVKPRRRKPPGQKAHAVGPA